jgi:hypothetical protein
LKKARPGVRNNAKSGAANRARATNSCRLIGTFLLSMVFLESAGAGDPRTLADGRSPAFAIDKGNYLACHVIPGGTGMGNLGPRLAQMLARYSTWQLLREQIWDAGAINPNSLMPALRGQQNFN